MRLTVTLSVEEDLILALIRSRRAKRKEPTTKSTIIRAALIHYLEEVEKLPLETIRKVINSTTVQSSKLAEVWPIGRKNLVVRKRGEDVMLACKPST